MRIHMAERQEGERLYPRLRSRFMSIIFGFTLMSMLITGGGLLLLNGSGTLVSPLALSPLLTLLAVYAMSTCVSSLLAYYVGRQILAPIEQLSEASKRVAKGDFSVRLASDRRIDEIDTTFNSFNSMVEELSSIETLREDFVANVSHEFKTPLSAIEGYATLLSDDGLSSAERRECAEKILKSARRLSELTGNILLLSKLETRGFSAEESEFRLDEQLREAILAFEPEWSAKELEVEPELPELSITGYEGLLERLWSNLIGNAVKFTPAGGRIGVRLKTRPGRFAVSVTDSGPGMTRETSQHIFDKFYQGDTSHRSEGNGLGLSLCRRIADLSGGYITVDSTPGRGSTFTVDLPMNRRQS